MTKEELKEMIDATIVGNGKQEITGQALNLALNTIADSIGSGINTVYYIIEDMLYDDSPGFQEKMRTQLENNKQIYEKLSNLFESTATAAPITLDLSVFNVWDGDPIGVNIPASIAMIKVSEVAPQSMSSSNFFDVYESGQIAINIFGQQQIPFQSDYSFWLTPNGMCIPLYGNEE